MRRIFHRLLKVLAGSSRDDLRRQVQFFKAENEIPAVASPSASAPPPKSAAGS